MKASGRDDFEFIFVSSDRDEASFNEYFAEMPWLALPFSNRKAKGALSNMFDVSGIPTLVTIAPDGTVINKSARGPVAQDPTGANFPWPPAPLEDLEGGVECNGFDINEKPALIVLCDGAAQAVKDEVTAALLPIATEMAEAGKSAEDGPECIFFTGKQAGGVVPRIRDLTGLKEVPATAQMIMLDIPDDGGFYVAGDVPVNAESIRGFLEDYKSKSLSRQQLKKS